MYTQIFFVTSVRGIVFPPQIAANSGLRVFGAKSPKPFLVALVSVVLVVVVTVVVVIAIERVELHANFE